MERDPLLDPNTWNVAEQRKQGYLTIPLTTKDHARNGPREFIRQVAEQFPDKLTVWTDVFVTRILFAEGADMERPYVNFHYFNEGNNANGSDLDAVVEGIRFARAMMAGSP